VYLLGNHAFRILFSVPTLRAALGFCALSLISACGSGGGGAADSTQDSAPVQLVAGLPTTGDFIAIAQTRISLPESSRSGKITVARQGNTNGTSSVQYRFVAGSANIDTDFQGADGTLHWNDGEGGEQNIHFLVESDLLSEGDETFQIQLFDATGVSKLGVNDNVVVTVTDSACTASVPASMTNTTVLSAPCYQLNAPATVGSSAQLTISPGTTIIAAARSGITLTGASTLNSEEKHCG